MVPFSVVRTDNAPRVRDGYIGLGTRGHARALKTQRERSICRKNVTADVRPCPRVPPLNLHGKEGVDGSSPSEGFRRKFLQSGYLESSFAHSYPTFGLSWGQVLAQGRSDRGPEARRRRALSFPEIKGRSVI